jgi:hypothetical protein
MARIASVTEREVDEFLKATNEEVLDLDFWAAVAETFRYQGFDPRHIMKLLILKEKDKRAFARDMKTIIVWVETRGTRISKEKVIKRTTAEGQDVIRRLQAKYNIRDEVPDSLDTVTLPRVVACFPQLVARTRMTFGYVRQIEDSPTGLPRFLCFPGAAALMSDTSTLGKSTFDLWIQWAVNFDMVINPRAHNVQKVRQYAEIVRNSSVIPRNKRDEILNDLIREETEARTKTIDPQSAGATQAMRALVESLRDIAPSTTMNEKETQLALGRPLPGQTAGQVSTVTLGASLFDQVPFGFRGSAGDYISTPTPPTGYPPAVGTSGSTTSAFPSRNV